MRVFISAGEPSGDIHGANLILEILKRRPDAEIVGFGGEKMESAGARLLYPLVNLAVMWFLRVLLNLDKFVGLLFKADRYFKRHKPDVLVLIDYPGFHWWLAKRAKARGIPVVYYVPPQLWAWAGWRVKKVRKYVDHVLCSLPFEPEWYRERGVAGAVYSGHPFFDEAAERRLDAGCLEGLKEPGGRLVAILPGSRTQEIARNLPMMIKAARKLLETRRDARFVIACLKEKHRDQAVELLRRHADGLYIETLVGQTPEILRAAEVAWAVSGSVSLELMIEALPTVVLYKVNKLDLLIARPFIKARFICLVNLLADAMVMPEYLTSMDVSTDLARWADRWLSDPAERARASRALAAIRDRVGMPGASSRAAERILEVAEGTIGKSLPPPHLSKLNSPSREPV